MTTRHAESGRPTAHSRRDRSPEVHRITSAPAAGHVDRDARFVRYAWQMGIRTICFILAFVTTGWPQIVFFALAIVLPYIAVVLANAGTVSNGEVLQAVPPVPRPELENRLQLTAGPDTVAGTTTDDERPVIVLALEPEAAPAPESSPVQGPGRAAEPGPVADRGRDPRAA